MYLYQHIQEISQKRTLVCWAWRGWKAQKERKYNGREVDMGGRKGKEMGGN